MWKVSWTERGPSSTGPTGLGIGGTFGTSIALCCCRLCCRTPWRNRPRKLTLCKYAERRDCCGTMSDACLAAEAAACPETRQCTTGDCCGAMPSDCLTAEAAACPEAKPHTSAPRSCLDSSPRCAFNACRNCWRDENMASRFQATMALLTYPSLSLCLPLSLSHSLSLSHLLLPCPLVCLPHCSCLPHWLRLLKLLHCLKPNLAFLPLPPRPALPPLPQSATSALLATQPGSDGVCLACPLSCLSQPRPASPCLALPCLPFFLVGGRVTNSLEVIVIELAALPTAAMVHACVPSFCQGTRVLTRDESPAMSPGYPRRS